MTPSGQSGALSTGRHLRKGVTNGVAEHGAGGSEHGGSESPAEADDDDAVEREDRGTASIGGWGWDGGRTLAEQGRGGDSSEGRTGGVGERDEGLMARANLSQLVADTWDEELREGPDPFRTSGEWLFERLGGTPRLSYRARLDRPVVNVYGDTVRRIVTVRRNLRALGPTRLDPARLR